VFFSRNKSANNPFHLEAYYHPPVPVQILNQCFQSWLFSKQTGYDDSCWSACLGVMKSSGEAFSSFWQIQLLSRRWPHGLLVWPGDEELNAIPCFVDRVSNFSFLLWCSNWANT